MLLITLKEVWSHNTMMTGFCIPVPFSAASLRLLNSTMKSKIKKCWPLLIALRPGVTTSKDRCISSKSIRIIRTWYGSQKLKVIIAARLAGPRNLPLSTSPLPYRPGSLGGKLDALSRRPDYRPTNGGDTLRQPNEFQVLKPHQLVNFPENEECIATINQLSLSTTVVQSLDPDVRFADKIKAALPTDPNIGPYLANLHDPTLPRDQLYLEPYSMSEDLVLRHGLIYIPNDDE